MNPLPREDLVRALAVIADRAVLVGGPAVAWWAEHYARQGRLERITEPTGMYVSKDADFAPLQLADAELRALVKDVARRVGGRSVINHEFGSLRDPAPGARPRRPGVRRRSGGRIAARVP